MSLYFSALTVCFVGVLSNCGFILYLLPITDKTVRTKTNKKFDVDQFIECPFSQLSCKVALMIVVLVEKRSAWAVELLITSLIKNCWIKVVKI